MDSEHHDNHDQGGHDDGHDGEDYTPFHELPPDLPRTLDDRRDFPSYGFGDETEMYDAWQGMDSPWKRGPTVF